MSYIKKICDMKPSIKPREETDKFFFLPGGNMHFDGTADFHARYIEKIQLKDAELWKLVVNQFRDNVDDDDNGWRCEYWGKLMRGACMVYEYTHDAELYGIMTDTVRDLLTTQRDDGRFATYSTEHEFCGWDLWGRKYVMLGMEYFYDICTDDVLKKEIISALKKHADYIVERIGEDKIPINTTGAYWKGLNSSSILEPFVRLYNLTDEKRYLDFASYIIDEGALIDDNIFERAYEGKIYPYQYTATKAYEMMSCFEGLLEYYRVTGIEKHRISVENFVNQLYSSEITIIGSAGCYHELFNHSSIQQGNYEYEGLLQETCVTVTWMKLCSQVLCLNGDARLADCMEKSAYNALYGAVNTEGSICNGALPFDSYSPLFAQKRGRGIGGLKYMEDGRYYGCCAAIGAAGVGLAANFAVMAARDGVVVNMYGHGTAELKTPNGDNLTMEFKTNYPYEETADITVLSDGDEEFAVYLRIPAWSRNTKVSVNGENVENVTSGEYLKLEKINGKTLIKIEFDMTPVYIECPDFDGRKEPLKPHAAIARGPIILARDVRFKENVDELLTLDINKMPKTEKSDDGKFTRNIEFTAYDENGKKFHMTDYASAGKTFNDDSRMAAWLPIRG